MTNDDPEALSTQLRARAPDTLALLEQLVRVNSHTRNTRGVDAVGALLAAALADTTLMLSTRRPDATLGEHLCFRSKAEGAPILLIGHHDTVFPEGSFEGFRRLGDVAFGPGVLDMKGGLALVITVLRTLSSAGLLKEIPLRFISVSDEEIGSPSSQAWLRTLAERARCALVFEAGRAGDAIITARRGSGSALVVAEGRAAHAGNALQDGKNAIWALSRFVDLAQRSNGTIAGASLNVGLVRGGTARNTVPDLAQAELDLRFSDTRGQKLLEATLSEAMRAAEREVPGTRLTLELTVARRPWERSAASSGLCHSYASCQRAAGLSAGEAGVIGGGSDANTVGALGLPTIDGLGPRGHGFHTRDEQIEISSLALKADALLRFLLGMRG